MGEMIAHCAWSAIAAVSAAGRRTASCVVVDEAREAKRQELSERLLAAAEGRDPIKFLHHLRQQRRGYDPKHDGPSGLMDLVDEIHELAKSEGAEL